MYRHMRDNCKIRKEKDLEKEKIFDRLMKLEKKNKKFRKLKKDNKRLIKIENENKALKKKMENMEKRLNNNKMIVNGNVIGDVNVNNGTVNNGTVNNVTLVAYGSEDISKLDKTDILRILRNGYNSSLKLTEAVHFNPMYPEYQNIYITNMKDAYVIFIFR